MSNWRVERHYGFGAAQIAIRPEAHRTAQIGLFEGAGGLVGELTEGGVIATLRRASGEASALLLSFLILFAVIVTLTRDHSDVSDIEVVLLETAVLPPPPVIEEPIPVPVEIAKPKPEPVVRTPRPPPPPQRIADRPKPPPPPPAVKPKPRPKPVIPQIAKLEAPKPPPRERIDREIRNRPKPIARPRVEIDAARPSPSPAPAVPPADRLARVPVDRANPKRATPRMTAPAAPALDLPSEPPPERAFRVASAKPTAGERPRARPGIAPPPVRRETAPVAPGPRRARASAPRPAASRGARRPVPTAPAAPVPRAPAPSSSAAPERTARALPQAPTRRAPLPAAQVARVGSAAAVPSVPTRASRSGREVPDVPRGSRADRPGVAGVPLGDLAACLSDREEDRLKQAVVAAVTTQKECVSNKGTYRFVETKNLNAFLMWIDRAPSRPVSDRCEELGNALECLENAGRRAAR